MLRLRHTLELLKKVITPPSNDLHVHQLLNELGGRGPGSEPEAPNVAPQQRRPQSKGQRVLDGAQEGLEGESKEKHTLQLD